MYATMHNGCNLCQKKTKKSKSLKAACAMFIVYFRVAQNKAVDFIFVREKMKRCGTNASNNEKMKQCESSRCRSNNY